MDTSTIEDQKVIFNIHASQNFSHTISILLFPTEIFVTALFILNLSCNRNSRSSPGFSEIVTYEIF